MDGTGRAGGLVDWAGEDGVPWWEGGLPVGGDDLMVGEGGRRLDWTFLVRFVFLSLLGRTRGKSDEMDE